ncbi:MAG: pyrimidine dimer DNA glycosylase/endonuclease V [Candidatus Omnitrophica bacterium]|nr:pyrimidine dimer DNA glycosylase/endonuclease V [Candidatus Omnitrophota bacterium]
MRIWDIHPKFLCSKHLLGEHRELHAIWSILTQNKKGYSKHPETLRWKGKLKALFLRHRLLVEEMEKRNFRHKSRLGLCFVQGKKTQNTFLDSIARQRLILRNKKCGCKV